MMTGSGMGAKLDAYSTADVSRPLVVVVVIVVASMVDYDNDNEDGLGRTRNLCTAPLD
jgi:hypothetical protein